MAALNYVFDDVVKRAKEAGVYDQISDADLMAAQQDPNYGMATVENKVKYGTAKTAEERALLNAEQESMRKNLFGYTGGVDGSEYNYTGLAPTQQELPEYQESKQGAQARTLSDQLVNRPAFSYDKNKDPSYGAYAKQYRREGDRATANAVGQAAAATGGIPSSYAVTAASQAGDYYASKLADKLPELYQQAYQRYLDEYTLKNSTIATLNGMEQQNYARHRDTVGDVKDQNSVNYAAYLERVKSAKEAEETAYNRGVYADETAYNRDVYADETAYNREIYADETAYNRDQAAKQAEILGSQTAWENAYKERGQEADIEKQTKSLELDALELALKKQQGNGGAGFEQFKQAFANVASGDYTAEDLAVLHANDMDVSEYMDGVKDGGKLNGEDVPTQRTLTGYAIDEMRKASVPEDIISGLMNESEFNRQVISGDIVTSGVEYKDYATYVAAYIEYAKEAVG